MLKVYLAGAITGQSFGSASGWRDEAKEAFLEVGINGYSPMRGRSFVANIAVMSDEDKKNFNGGTMHSIVGINVRDFNDVKTADAILVNLLGVEKVSIGTVMEIAWARAFQIPVVIVMEKENIHNHGMLTFGNIITNDLTDGILSIIQLLKP